MSDRIAHERRYERSAAIRSWRRLAASKVRRCHSHRVLLRTEPTAAGRSRAFASATFARVAAEKGAAIPGIVNSRRSVRVHRSGGELQSVDPADRRSIDGRPPALDDCLP